MEGRPSKGLVSEYQIQEIESEDLAGEDLESNYITNGSYAQGIPS